MSTLSTLHVYVGSVDMDCDGPSTAVFRLDFPSREVIDLRRYGFNDLRRERKLHTMIREALLRDELSCSLGDVSEWFELDEEALTVFVGRLDEFGQRYLADNGYGRVNGNIWR